MIIALIIAGAVIVGSGLLSLPALAGAQRERRGAESYSQAHRDALEVERLWEALSPEDKKTMNRPVLKAHRYRATIGQAYNGRREISYTRDGIAVTLPQSYIQGPRRIRGARKVSREGLAYLKAVTEGSAQPNKYTLYR